MRLIDYVNGPWAITPEMHDEVLGIYGRHMRGEELDVAALEARLGMPLKNQPQGMSTDDSGNALISVEGVLAKRMNLFSQISGGASTQLIGAQFAQALADPNVSRIVMLFDSPGGTVDGTQQLATQIAAARGAKPVVAVVDGMCCSAAYWIASACDQIFITSDTAQVGSIGVISTHVDRSMAQAQNGVKVTEVKAGKYKGQGSPNAPLGSAEVTMQDTVDKLYQTFVGNVATNRDLSTDDAQDWANGRVFIGQDAIAAGLVDGVSTLEDVLANGSGGSPAQFTAIRAGDAPTASIQTQETEMTLTVDKLKADNPALVAALQAEFQASVAASNEASVAKARGDAVTAERARVSAIEALALPGTEALVAEAKGDGSTPEAFAMKLVAFQKDRNSKALAALETDAKTVTTTAATPVEQEPAAQSLDPRSLAAKAQAHIAAEAAQGRKVSAAEAVVAVSRAASV